VSAPQSIFDNRGTVTCERIAVNDSATISNSATIECNFLGDSAASFHNAGNIPLIPIFLTGMTPFFKMPDTCILVVIFTMDLMHRFEPPV